MFILDKKEQTLTICSYQNVILITQKATGNL